ncbi:MAG: rhodanese-related sulfurtransferase [Candidatus Magasanikbacteria bacterium]|nr:rhodanese-related sulfurtransferase [Candidatus Magasanikbacteria bacterium]
MQNTKHEILLYYKYIEIENPEEFKNEHRKLCEDLGFTARIIISKEGINGTLEGLPEQTQKYIDIMHADPRFSDMHFKRSPGTGNAFPKLSIKVRDEIVSLHLDEDVDPRVMTGTYIQAEELHELINSDEEFYIIDMRNEYEHKVGFFENSILPSLKNFRDLPQLVEDFSHLKDKKVVTVCTGGVRCEKASGFLVKHGFTNVYQLFGGIVTYMEKYPNENFKGKLYVFDGRVTMGLNVDSPEHVVVSTCDTCGAVSDQYIDCAHIHCKGNRHFVCCLDCVKRLGGYCGEECREKDMVKKMVIV